MLRQLPRQLVLFALQAKRVTRLIGDFAEVEGVNLLALSVSILEYRRPQSVRDTLYFAYVSSQRAVKDRSHKLIEYCARDRGRQTQLFDIANDPWELTNLVGTPGADAIVCGRPRSR